MGLSESKMVVEVVSRACAEAEKSGNDAIKPALNDKVLDSLHSIWSNLPDTAKRKIDRDATKENANTSMATKRKKDDGRSERARAPKKTKPNNALDSEVALLPYLLKNVAAWKKDPLSFFNEGKSKLELKSFPLDEMSNYMTNLNTRTGIDQIRQRLLKTMHFRLSGWVGWTELHRKRAKRVEQTASDKNVLQWVPEGNRIDKLCREIGCVTDTERSDQYFHLGNIFYSLPDIFDTFVRKLPLTADFSQLPQIQRLKKRSRLCDTESRKLLEELAHEISKAIWEACTESNSPFPYTAEYPEFDPGINDQTLNSPPPPATEPSQFNPSLINQNLFDQRFTEPPHFNPGLDGLTYAQAFSQPFTELPQFDPGLDDLSYAQAFSQPFSSATGTPQLDYTSYAQAFSRPFTSAAEPPQFDPGPQCQNYTPAYNPSFSPTALNPAPDSSGGETSDNFTANSLECGYSGPLGTSDVPCTTESRGYRNNVRAAEPLRHASTKRLNNENIARLWGGGPIQSTTNTVIMAG
ncbi:hypothetical protein N7541_007936 [Penicillium brevicompactum]|uniref:Uncharacterized protein n=1 Tax=Penicillium brevicompactum TaxID=5074 RepID=A0A9W9R132_PENBR|nr:hypothetical protein N7541_007936 [Penicillium brevicompactum]